MKIKVNVIITNAIAVVVGTWLMFVLWRFLSVPTHIPETNINLGIAVLAIFAAIFGPIVGCLVGFFGHLLNDLSWGSVWWGWVIASAFFGFFIGLFRKFYHIRSGTYGIVQGLIFNGVQAIANILSYVFIARILDLVFSEDMSFELISDQGFTAAAVNMVVVLVIGTIPVIGFFKNRARSDGQKAEINVSQITGFKGVIKVIGTWLLLGMFLVSSFMTLFISELVNRQMANYENTVVQMTEYHLESAVQTLSMLVSVDVLDLFQTIDDMKRPEYQETRKKLLKFSEDYKVKFAYYWRHIENDRFQFIVDNDEDPETQVGLGDFDLIHDDVERAALDGQIGVSDLGSYSPDWQGLLSAFAPVYDKDGNVYCVAGVDISDEFIFTQRQDSRNMKMRLLVIVPIAVIFGVLNMMLFRRKAIQIEEAHIKLQYFNNNMRRAFSTYLSEEVVEEIVSDPSRLQLGGEKRHMTALFTDVKGFSSIAEQLTPEKLVDLLNYYLSTMSDIILEQKGTIDKYQGDAIISFFGAPIDLHDHAMRACISAIVMRRLEKEVNEHIKENSLSPMPLLTRFGINSGEMVVGNMGTQKKMNYTIISNAVNLAARLEGVNKQYGTWILASEDTINDTKGKLLTRRLDRIRVVGINEPVRIYEILETMHDAPAALHNKVKVFDEALKIFEGQKWKEAEAAFTQLLATYPNDNPSKVYITRCKKFQQYPPAADWDGVFNFTEK
jgi:class 3 adenylate cyclase/uncharacterized membrane protein